MKRFTIFIMTLLLTFLQMAAQDTNIKGTITLSHQGNETDFAYNEMGKVMDAAVDGDTVFLSTGYFLGDFIMTKKLAFIGAGADSDNGWNNCTYYDGKIVINLPENTTLTSRLFDGIYLSDNNNYISFNSSIDNVIFRKCRFNLNDNWRFSSEVKNIIIDRCYLRIWRNSSQNVKKIIGRNCYITNFYIDDVNPSSYVFYHCNISTPSFGNGSSTYSFCQLRHTFVNCIIDNGQDTYLAYPNNEDYTPILINCLYKASDKIDVTSNCTMQNSYGYNANGYVFNLTKEELQSNNYLGNDGTVVGCYGGKNPYTLSISNKEVTNKFHLDRDKKQIQFNIKVSDQQ